MGDEGMLSLSDAAKIGFKVVDMADRVKVGHACLPGSKATWHFEMDGTRYIVDIRVADDAATPGVSRPNEGG